MKTTLVIMAAGIGSRFGGGVKQLTPVGPNGEIIIDYSIYDAIEAGFNRIVFIIRKDIEVDFREVIGNRLEEALEGKAEIVYVFQDINSVPEGFSVPEGRIKPWGTGQAVLACKGLVNEPFAVINADDYYGKEAFVKLHDYLVTNAEKQFNYCMAGFILENTLSENGGVTRGICVVNAEDKLTGVDETSNIIKTATGAEADGKVIDPKAHVSMNMWGLTPEFIEVLDEGFVEFLDSIDENPHKAEYLLPIIIDKLIKEEKASVKVLETKDKWFGVTYASDKDYVIDSFKKLVEDGVYQSPLM